jgi:anti-sigma-K factor RskA
MTDPTSTDDKSDLAAEFALGVLDGNDRLRAQALLHSDPAFAAEVELWQTRLAPLLREVGPIQPSAQVWRQVATRIGSANDNRVAPGWRAGALAAGMVAAALALFIAVDPRHRPVEVVQAPAAAIATVHVAQLVDAAGKPLMTATYDPASGTMRISQPTVRETGRVPELWLIPSGGKPTSLGELTSEGSNRVIPPPALQALVRDGATLAITMERREGIPHAAPTSAIVASGTLTSI